MTADPRTILARASAILDDRGAVYGDFEDSFGRAAQIASLKLNKVITPHDVVVMLESVKDARLALNPTHQDSLIDRVNYAAFRAIFAQQQEHEHEHRGRGQTRRSDPGRNRRGGSRGRD